MIMGTFGPYLAKTAHDHETVPEGCTPQSTQGARGAEVAANAVAFRAWSMIMASLGRYLAVSGHDHEMAPIRGASLKFPANDPPSQPATHPASQRPTQPAS